MNRAMKITIARHLFNITKHQEYFSVNDLRLYRLDEKFDHPNAIGSFFRWLQENNFAIKVGQTVVKHQAAKRRGGGTGTWFWSSKAWALFKNHRMSVYV